MRNLLIAFAISITLLGCSSTKVQLNRNISNLIVNELQISSAKIKKHETLPKINCTWELDRDELGVVIKIYGTTHDQIQNLLKILLGPPTKYTTKTIDGKPSTRYRIVKN